MGGPCDYAMHGDDAKTVMMMGGKHLEEMKDDPAHAEAYKMMAETGKDPAANAAWMKKFEEDFAAMPED